MKFKNSNYGLIFIPILIFFLGLLNLYSVTHTVTKQILWFLVSLFIGIVVYRIGLRVLLHYSFLLYLMGILLLIATYFFPSTARVHSWLKLGPLNIQTSQLMKVILPLFIVHFLSYREIKSWYQLFPPLIFLLIPFFLIVKQPDLGASFLLLPGFVSIIWAKRLSMRVILPWLILVIILTPFAYNNLHDYQKQRLLVFIKPDYEPLGAGYTLTQSKIAIGSGKFLGKGWRKGAQARLKFLPESHTDFVFPVFAEECGFFGSSILLFLYFLLLRKIYFLTQKVREETTRLVLGAYFYTFFAQIFINLGMSMGIFPVVGLPLPLFSYGGSDLAVTFWILAIFLNEGRNL